MHHTLHSALDYARRARLVSTNVSDDARLPPREEPRQQPLTAEQASLLLQKVKEHELEGLLTLALATGMREGELLGLRWADIDFTKGIVQVGRTLTYISGHGFIESKPKTARSKRRIVLPQFAMDVLKHHRAKQLEKRLAAGSSWVDRDLIFPDRDGDYLIPVTLLRRFRKLLRNAGLPRIRFHDLRHSAATLLLGMGVEMKIVQELLGHSSISITADIYGHVLPPMYKSAMDKMDGFLGSSSS